MALDEKMKETLFFLLRLLVLSVPLYLIIWLRLDLSFLQEAVTRNVISFLGLAGIPAGREGFLLAARGFSFYISKDCTGWKGMLFLAALILATKASWKKRAVGLAAGLPAVFAFNLLRIIFMIWLGMSSPELFGVFHDFLWQLSMIGAVILLWLMWTKLDINSLKK